MQASELDSMGDWQHGDTGARVVVAPRDRQGPEVRWRPDENDQKEHQGVGIDGVGYSGPSKHRRSRSRRPAYDDVLGSRALQPHGVDHRVANE